MTHRVLIVDSDPHTASFLARGLKETGIEVVHVNGGREGMSMLREKPFDAVVSELQMPEVDGLDILRFTQGLAQPPAFVIMTGYGSVHTAVKAMKYGAGDFVEKPVSVAELSETLQNVISDHQHTHPVTDEEEDSWSLVGDRLWIKPFMDCLKRIAHSDATVLIQGETGTGKSLVARELAQCSHRSEGPFVEVNCAAIPEHLLESELFGHVRGAFTGATNTRIGRVEAARGGTLFLDEVGELRLDLQAKLLHVLQERTFQPIGSTRTMKADVRFVTATNRNLMKEVQEKRFRADLYYRLNVVALSVPPLRDRPDDVPILIEHFCRRVTERMKTGVPRFSPEATAMLRKYSWPGNVRELENLVQRVAVIYPPSTTITPDHLQDRIRYAPYQMSLDGLLSDVQMADEPERHAVPTQAAPEPPAVAQLKPEQSLSDALQTYERELISHALRQSDGNRSQAAKLLGTKRTTLLEKMKRLDLLEV